MTTVLGLAGFAYGVIAASHGDVIMGILVGPYVPGPFGAIVGGVIGAIIGLVREKRKNARAIKSLADELPCHGRIDMVRVDPAATARSSLGPAAYSEYERVFGTRLIARWPQHIVLDGLDTLELLLEGGNLLIHPRCTRLKDAFQNYRRQRRGGQWIDFPADGHPEEDLIDALRGGVRDALPHGNALTPYLPRVHAGRVFH